jgi:uncharacterized protein DUF4255
MSNFLAIATVTAGLSDMLQTAILADVSGATVTTLPPDNSGVPSVGVNVFMYQVTPNPAWRNTDLPTRRANSELVQRPRAALDLHYLLTFYGADGQLEPQRVLGSVVRTLHAQPILSRDAIRTTIAKASFSFLAKSNLADEIELVRFTPLTFSLEELSKFWSITFQTPYRLSTGYEASVVLVESEDSTHAALPVRRRNLYVVPFRQVLVEDIGLADGSAEFIGPESTIAIRGRQLRADLVEVHIGDAVVTPDRDKTSDSEITIKLPAGLRAGVQGLQVVQPRLMGTPPVAHRGVSSNLAPFVLHPAIVSTAVAANEIAATVKPRVGKTQRATLLLNELNPPSTRAPRAFSFEATPRKPADPPDTDTPRFPFSGVPAGDYLARVQIDGADSALVPDPDPNQPRFIGPKVTIP